MKVTLKPSWELTTDHASSSYGQAVLVNRGSGEAYGPSDMLQLYPSWPYLPAAEAVERMARMKKFTYDEQVAVDRFVNFGK